MGFVKHMANVHKKGVDSVDLEEKKMWAVRLPVRRRVPVEDARYAKPHPEILDAF